MFHHGQGLGQHIEIGRKVKSLQKKKKRRRKYTSGTGETEIRRYWKYTGKQEEENVR
jgi:hypothetical protein